MGNWWTRSCWHRLVGVEEQIMNENDKSDSVVQFIEEYKPVAKMMTMQTPNWLWLFAGTSALLALAVYMNERPVRNPLPPFPAVGPMPPLHLGPAFWLGPMAVL
jgi:hypothetical protein